MSIISVSGYFRTLLLSFALLTLIGHDISRIIGYATNKSTHRSYNVISKAIATAEPISILTFSSRKRGLLQLPGYFGSLINNTAASRLDIYFVADDVAYYLLHDCVPSLQRVFHNMTLRSLHEFDNHVLFTRYEKYFKTGYVNPKFVDNNLYQRYHTAIFKLDVVNTVPSTLPRVIVLDVDMLVLEDLSHMHEEGLNMKDKFMIATMEGYSEDSYFTGGKKYKNTKKHFFKPYGLNTGAVIFDLELMRKDNLTASKFIEINDEFPRIPDQDMFNTWAYYNPERVGILSCRWNTREYVPCFARNVTFNESRLDRGIFHGNNMKGLSPFIMDPTPEYAYEQRLHREYSNIFFKICGITPERMNQAVKQAHQAEAKITLS